MGKRLKIDRAIYLVDDKTKTYRLLSRNPEWENLRPQENERNKRHIDGAHAFSKLVVGRPSGIEQQRERS